MKTLMRPIICAHLCICFLIPWLTPQPAVSQTSPAHRLVISAGTLLVIPDSTTGLTLWATRPARAGYRPSPDFVGWFEPDSVVAWSARTREFLSGSAAESASLTAWDGGRVNLVRMEDACCAIAFGHPGETQRWIIEASAAEIVMFLDSLDLLARSSRLHPPEDLVYANPTNRKATPDRTVAPSPAFRADSGEVWARLTLDRSGVVMPGSESILWATRKDLGDAVLRVLSGYRYRRKDAKAQRMMVYQRFRVRGLGGER